MKKAKNTGDVSITGSPGATVNVGVVSENHADSPGPSGMSDATPEPPKQTPGKVRRWDWKWVIGALLVPIAIGVVTILYLGRESTPDVEQTTVIEGNDNKSEQTASDSKESNDVSQHMTVKGDRNEEVQRVIGEGDSK